MTADVAVVVVTYNSAHVVGDLLDSLPAALDGLDAVTFVVDNSSSDDTREVVAARGDCDLVVAENLGYAAGINRGVAHAPGGVPVLVLNPDLMLAPGAVRRLVDALQRPRAGIIVPRVVGPDGALLPSMRREPSLLRAVGLSKLHHPAFSEYVDDPVDYDRAHECDWALGAALLLSRPCLDAVGQWDESFFLYSEETDFCLRARDLGWRTWYEPSAEVMHIGGQSGTSPRIHVMQILNRVRLYRRRHGVVASTAYHVLTVASELSWLVRGRRYSAAAVHALLRPSVRPAELGISSSFLPR